MKLKEKLAENHADSFGPSEEFATAKLSFLAGFEAAKRLVLELPRDEHPGFGTRYVLLSGLKKLGEEEVNETP